MHWNYQPICESATSNLSKSLNISYALASMLVRLDITDAIKAQKFLYPRLAHLDDPFLLNYMEDAAERLLKSINAKEEILILGDYDADGITSTSLLVNVLNQLGVKPNYIIPKRLEEGYGLTMGVVERALKIHTPSLFIALDCGTNSIKEVQFLKQKGIEVIILDHHKCKEGVLPEDAILVNPHVHGKKEAPWGRLCTVGLVFKLVHGLVKILKEEEDPRAKTIKLKDLLDLVALGTIADLVPLVEENRILTYYGLNKIQHTNRPGLQALCKVSGINEGQTIKPSDVAFRLGPRINASGRLSDATLPVNMLLSKDFEECSEAAKELNLMNRERQEIERAVTLEAESLIATAENNTHQISIVSYSPNWHTGVVGIVAGKLARMYHKPTIILGNENGLAKGSGRSIPGIDLIKALSECEAFLESWGGHPMAAGIALKTENLENFQEQFTTAIATQLNGLQLEPFIEITQFIEAEDLTEALLEELELLHPFGNNNPEPIFGVKEALLLSEPQIFAGSHIKFKIAKKNGLPVNAIGWNMKDNPPPANQYVDLAVKFSYNHWNGKKTPQAELIDWKLAEVPAFAGTF